MKQLFYLFLLFLSHGILLAQQPIPIVQAWSTEVSVRDGENFKKNHWSILPEVKPDVYHVDRFKGRKKVTFYTDTDSISFVVEKERNYDFIILLNGKDTAYTRISSVTPLPLIYERLDGGPVGVDTIHFSLSWQNKIHFKGRINGSDLLDMMFDTGANGIVMSSDAFKKNVKLKIDGTIQGAGLGGQTQDQVSYKNRLEIAGLKWNDISLSVKTQGKPSEDVVIGYNVFDGKVVEIDYEKKMIVVHSAMPLLKKKYTSHELRFKDGLSYIKVTLKTNKQTIEGWFDFDTGSSSTVFVNKEFNVLNQLSNSVKKVGSGSLKGSGPNKVEIDKLLLPGLSLGDLFLQNVTIEAEAPSSSGATPFNIIGSDILKRFNMVIDYQNDKVYLSPNSLQHDMYFQDKVKYVIYGSIAFFLLLLIGGIIFYKRKQRRKKLQGGLNIPS